jgi:hypothetical protein
MKRLRAGPAWAASALCLFFLSACGNVLSPSDGVEGPKLSDLNKTSLLRGTVVPGGVVTARILIAGDPSNDVTTDTVDVKLPKDVGVGSAFALARRAVVEAGGWVAQLDCAGGAPFLVAGVLNVPSTVPGVDRWVASVEIFVIAGTPVRIQAELVVPIGKPTPIDPVKKPTIVTGRCP